MLLAEIHVISPPTVNKSLNKLVCFTAMDQKISVYMPFTDNNIPSEWSELKMGYTIAILYPFKEGDRGIAMI